MSMQVWNPGDVVKASYKTGEYIGEIVELMNSGKVAVRILAVAGHPEQGNLHHPMDPDVPFFHERRALAYQEIALMPPQTVSPYRGAVPEYKASLLQALEREYERLDRLSRWAQRGQQELEKLRQEYT